MAYTSTKGNSSLVFIISGVIIFTLVVWGLVSPVSMETVMESLMSSMIQNFGWLYVLATAFFVGFCLFLGFGPYRHMKLGNKEDEPEYHYFTWVGMLFAAGMGVGLVFWGVAEPMSHYIAPPPGIEAETQYAAAQGLLYGVFHWGFHPWSIYAIVALGLAFAKYRKKLPGLISSAFYPLIGEHVFKKTGKFIDIIAIIATTVGIATSFGLSTMQVSNGFSQVFGWEDTLTIQLIIIAVITVIFLISVVTGLNKGMRYLSVGNLSLAGLLLVIALILGPTVFILDHFTKTIGQYAGALTELTFDTNPYSSREWMENWTLFYWAWVISWSPFVGTFIARVSRGRTLQEFILGVLFVPTGVTILWFVTFGGTGLYYDMVEGVDLAHSIARTPESGFFLVLNQFPLGSVLSLAGLLLIIIFFITSANSATYVLGVFSSNGNLNPQNYVMVVWGLLISSISAVLLTSGGLDGLQATATVTALPFIIIMLVMTSAIYMSLHKEGRAKQKITKKENW
ncbi:BCCT family transporter [Salipaludibacillus agaradhaerens]|uniref:BCCT family transporter n=1 Tax=Salipaludibacillus agaradhaerens TaxID=76935 RepID=A0A9Q4G0N5_SALAG|nr:BCCT family transporter [Salipaludibacillus agaradhaerens]MCR6098686.1 BCCT family transporter [Salipaludibacillus agaradhaerens]MCR6115693.1 BCCT family transporter [Salipaludibacillus agaradhaerens]